MDTFQFYWERFLETGNDNDRNWNLWLLVSFGLVGFLISRKNRLPTPIFACVLLGYVLFIASNTFSMAENLAMRDRAIALVHQLPVDKRPAGSETLLDRIPFWSRILPCHLAAD